MPRVATLYPPALYQTKNKNQSFLSQARHLEPKRRTHVLLYASHDVLTLANALGTKNAVYR